MYRHVFVKCFPHQKKFWPEKNIRLHTYVCITFWIASFSFFNEWFFLCLCHHVLARFIADLNSRWRQSDVVFLIICDVGRFSAVPISGLMISFNLFSWLRAAAASVAINNSWLNYMRNQPDHSYCRVPLGTPFNAGWKRNHHLVVAPKVGDSNDGFFVFVFLSTRRAILASTSQIKITRSVHSPPSIEHAFARWSRETPNRQRLALSHRRQPPWL